MIAPVRADVATLGYISVDHFIVLPYYPRSGEKLGMSRYIRLGGGQAGTAAVALARWGCRTRCIGRVGGDETGAESIRRLEDAGVLADAVLTTPGVTSQFAFIIVDQQTGERTVMWKREPALNLQPSDVREDWLSGVSVLLVDGHELRAAAHAAGIVRRNGGQVVLDAEGLGPARDVLLKEVDVCVASSYFGRREFGLSDPVDVIRRLKSYGIPVAGVTLGSNGSVVDWGDGLYRIPALDIDAVDTTGAGDIYHAGLAFALYRHMPPAGMFRFASAAASLSCRGLGGRSAIPSVETVSAAASQLKPEPLP